MAEPARKLDAYAQLKALPETMVGEVIGGELFAQPRPAPRHAVSSFDIAGELSGPFRKGEGGPGGWVFMVEPELHLGDDVLVPDIAGWRSERLTDLPDQAFIEIAPDWVCEILSPSTERLDRGAKMDRYHGAGVGHLWLLNPLSRHLEAYAAGDKDWLRAGTVVAGGSVSLPPFDAISFPIDNLFPLRFAGESEGEGS